MSNRILPLAVLAALFIIPGCATTKPEEVRTPTRVEDVIKERKVIVDTACDWVRPVYVHKLDQLTPGTARQILAHNETWEVKCVKQKTK